MGAHAKELVHDPPGEKPQFPTATVSLNGRLRPLVFRGIRVTRVQQEIGINNKHDLDTFHGTIHCVAICDVHQGCAHGVNG